MFRVKFYNEGGTLDSRDVETEKEAAEAAIAMIRDAGSLGVGDCLDVIRLPKEHQD